MDQQLYVFNSKGERVPLPTWSSTKPTQFDEIDMDISREQSYQWTTLLRMWPAIAILAGVSAILSAFTIQYVLAIVNACVFFGSFFCFITGGLRYYILVLFLLLYIFVGFLFETFYIIVLLTDFYKCNSDSCRGWRIYLYDLNFFFVVLLTGTLLLLVRQCWGMLVDHREITNYRFNKIIKND